ncbi:IS66 family transposase (plasmid) [Sphaerotilus sulfidivorans]|uniref:IS66 family transposase n=2 Tax=Sphaerotilus sulfidivorans TaxID=639200 RepID=A0A5C1PW04_9BURK|nr:IS66 family transposase [Sphaerotilus sulfidivorans]
MPRGDRHAGPAAGSAARAGGVAAGAGEAGLAQLVEAAVVGCGGHEPAAPQQRAQARRAARAQGHIPDAAGRGRGRRGARVPATRGVRVRRADRAGASAAPPGDGPGAGGAGRGAGVPAVPRGVRALPQDARERAAGRGAARADRAEGAGPDRGAGHAVPPDAGQDPHAAGRGAGGALQPGGDLAGARVVARALQAPVQQAAASCHGAAVLHMDETSWRQAGSGTRHWVWATVQPQVVVYQVLPSRARYVAQALAGERPAGVLVTDRYAVYDWVAPERRQVCWAHLLRDFERIAGRAGAAGGVGRRLLGLGRVLFRWRARDAGPAEFARLQARVHQALERGTRSGCRRTAQTCANLLAQEVSLWTFVRHPGVEPTNNAAEQALRTVVLKRKISGPTRSMRGQQFVARGFSAMESCRRQGRDLRDWMEQALRAWLGAGPMPSLLPGG